MYSYTKGELMTNIFKAIGDVNRLRILCLLSLYELCVCEIEVILDLSQSNVSRHLSKLKSVDIISGDKKAQWIHYKISEKFKLENDFLYKYLIEKFETSEEYIHLIERCKLYKESPYSCQTITNDKDFVFSFLERKEEL